MDHLGPGDKIFIENKVMPYFNIPAVAIQYSPSKAKWPDIWCDVSKRIITVTDEWRRQNAAERRKRIVHEFLHLTGMQHHKVGRLDYNTKPALDTYSKAVYENIANG